MTTSRYYRFPILFGGVVGVLYFGFSMRKRIFADGVEAVRRKNFEDTHFSEEAKALGKTIQEVEKRANQKT